MDDASYALWLELRNICLKRLRPMAIYGTVCCLLWPTVWLLFGQEGLHFLVLVWFALYLPVGLAHMLFGVGKDDWFDWFTPAFYLLSPLFAIFILCGQLRGVWHGKPFIPTILTGKGLARITRDSDGPWYCFTTTSGQRVAITRDEYNKNELFIRFHTTYGISGAVDSDLSRILMYLDDGLLGVPAATQPVA